MLEIRSKGLRFDPRPGHGGFLRVCDTKLNRIISFKRMACREGVAEEKSRCQDFRICLQLMSDFC